IRFSRIHLNFKIEERQNRAEKEFVFCLSRDEDPLYVYMLALRRNDYELLKREQELDADFDAFPKRIIDFVTCLDSSCGSHLRTGSTDDSSVLKFELVGKMGFKWVTILSLPLQKVTDKALVSHLVERITKYQVRLRFCCIVTVAGAHLLLPRHDIP
ncbi:unnamed protein product, partial [Gongylonema pulchrum]|uniref:SAS-6_N domain-containing protein n=1 Tax=Gongylonema pulchrum TaxID=637853 RepID=A0A183E344_9BILA